MNAIMLGVRLPFAQVMRITPGVEHTQKELRRVMLHMRPAPVAETRSEGEQAKDTMAHSQLQAYELLQRTLESTARPSCDLSAPAVHKQRLWH